MKTYWKKYQIWFAGLKPRERQIVALAVLLGGLFLGFTYGVEPKLLAGKRAAKLAAEAQLAETTLGQQIAVMRGAVGQDPDTPLRARLQQLEAELAGQGQRFAAVNNSLVPATQMARFLESVLGKGGSLQLVSLRTLPPTPVMSVKAAAGDKDKPGKPAATDPATPAAAAVPRLFKHGMEIRLAGSYNDLLAYVAALEDAPQRLLWGRLELAAEYPRSQLTLTVYTLSLEESWLTL